MRHSTIDVLCVPSSLKKNRIRMLKSLSILKKMHADGTNVFASNIIDNIIEIDQITCIQCA